MKVRVIKWRKTISRLCVTIGRGEEEGDIPGWYLPHQVCEHIITHPELVTFINHRLQTNPRTTYPLDERLTT